MAFDIREDGHGGILLATISTSVLPYLTLRRVDASGNVTWEDSSAIQFLLPSGAASWPPHAWADLVKIVPDASGGALVVFQSWQGNGSQPRLESICVDSHGMESAAPQPVTGRTTRQDTPLVIPAGGSNAIVAWAEPVPLRGLDAWTQRVGCCQISQGIDPGPIWPCGVPEEPGLPYGGLALSLGCGDRDSQTGVIPLSQLGRMVPGLDLPSCLTNRAAHPPDWMRIAFLGLPAAIQVELQAAKGKVVAASVLLEGPGKTLAGKALTFRPPGKEDEVLVFRHNGAPMKDPKVIVQVSVQWGDGEPPPPPQPPEVA
jgi:hypothetical protein